VNDISLISGARAALAPRIDEKMKFFPEEGTSFSITFPGNLKMRVTRLGHMQCGGVLGYFDRMLDTLLGAAATELLANGEHGKLLGRSKVRS
jgi:6-phosphofructokinase